MERLGGPEELEKETERYEAEGGERTCTGQAPTVFILIGRDKVLIT